MNARRIALLCLSALVVALTVIPASVGEAATRQPAPPRSGKLKVGVEVLRFAAAGRQLRATGLVTANLTDNAGHRSTAHAAVALTAQAGGNCRVLHLFLNELTLHLLGLNAHLDKVTLDITGNRAGGVLGALFCRLAKAKVASARTANVRALNAAIRHRRTHALRFSATLRPQAHASQAPNGTICPVLDLVVGPLNLQLLGLVVNLQKVHLVVTATKGEGKLGDLFCGLADR
ncbi:MAG TPA: hypothetical protein VGN69_02905 [Solirubrobacteraceae bacterium]|nr:hypothetical protein [Solirubrobacteraceae bacterium]